MKLFGDMEKIKFFSNRTDFVVTLMNENYNRKSEITADKSPIIADKLPINNTDIEKFIIEYLKNNEYITNKVLQDVCNIKDTKSKTILRNLVSREIILLEGANKNRRYKLNRKK